jgi:hypothetical protein
MLENRFLVCHQTLEAVEKFGPEPKFFCLSRLSSVLSRRSGGTSTMMGQQTRTESLFYYFRLEDEIPEDHLLRLIDQHVELSFVRERVKGLYSTTGRPSIDPEVLLRLLLVGICTG